MKLGLLLACGVAGAMAEDFPQSAEKIRSAMEQPLAAQRESVRTQVRGGKPVEASFFTVAWPWDAATPQGGPPAAQADCSPLAPWQVERQIQEAARREGFTPDLLRAVIDRESRYRPCAVSRKGAQGLMQLMPETALSLGVADPFDPEENIDAGARYLGVLLEKYGGDVALALGAYNSGPGRVDQYKGVPPIPETLNYVADILAKLKLGPEGQP